MLTDPLTILEGDVLAQLATLPDASIHCCITSPPYWGLRDYGLPPSVWGGDPACAHEWAEHRQYKDSPTRGGDEGVGFDDADVTRDQRWKTSAYCERCGAWRGQLGLEPTPTEYVDHLVAVFRAVRRVLRPDGTLWLNLGDSYVSQGGTGQARHWDGRAKNTETQSLRARPDGGAAGVVRPGSGGGLKVKDLVGIPWRVAFALQADGWWLRQDIIWAKPNPMPESVTDRCTKAHEYIFLLAQGERYYYDAEAIKELSSGVTGGGVSRAYAEAQPGHGAMRMERPEDTGLRNRRDVWSVPTQPYPEAHFATWPEALVRPMVLAGCPPDGRVLDPFGGSGTTAAVALQVGRQATLVELNPAYVALIRKRCRVTLGLPGLS